MTVNKGWIPSGDNVALLGIAVAALLDRIVSKWRNRKAVDTEAASSTVGDALKNTQSAMEFADRIDERFERAMGRVDDLQEKLGEAQQTIGTLTSRVASLEAKLEQSNTAFDAIRYELHESRAEHREDRRYIDVFMRDYRQRNIPIPPRPEPE